MASTTGAGILNHSFGFRASSEFLSENKDRSTTSIFPILVTVKVSRGVRQMRDRFFRLNSERKRRYKLLIFDKHLHEVTSLSSSVPC